MPKEDKKEKFDFWISQRIWKVQNVRKSKLFINFWWLEVGKGSRFMKSFIWK